MPLRVTFILSLLLGLSLSLHASGAESPPQGEPSEQAGAASPTPEEGGEAGSERERTPIPVPGRGERSWLYGLSFCLGAALLALLLSRRLFREELAGRKTLRFMEDKLGPFFEEFSITHLYRWAERAAEHIDYAHRSGNLKQLELFSTATLLDTFQSAQRDRLIKVLTVHPLSLQLPDDRAEFLPPAGLKLALRVELKVARAVEGDPKIARPRQRQELWTLQHDGRRWLLDSCRVLQQGESLTLVSDLEALPPLMKWKREA